MNEKGGEERRPPPVPQRDDLELAVNRCPFCHDQVEVAESDWVPCADCQARHHTACWTESGKCAACGAEQHLVPEASPSPSSARATWRPLAALACVLVATTLGSLLLSRLANPAVEAPVSQSEPPAVGPSTPAPPAPEQLTQPEPVEVALDPAEEAKAWWDLGFGHVRDDPAKSIPAFDRALELDPTHRSALGRRIEARARTGDYAGAIADADRFLQFEDRSGFSEAWAWRALANLGLGHYEEAIADAERALAITDRQSYAYLFRAEAHDRMGNQALAEADYQRAVALAPDASRAPGAYRYRGRYRYRQGDYQGALSDHRRALIGPQLPNENRRDLRWIARALAAIDCQLPLEHDPRFAFAYDDRGHPLPPDYLRGSLDDFRAATGLRVEDRYALIYRGLARRLNGDPHGAVEDYSKLLAGRPKEFKALSGRGSAHFDLGEWERALTDYTRALEIKPEMRETLFSRGLVLWKLGRFAEAEADLNAALALDPELTQARVIRGLVRRARGREDEALEDLRWALERLPPGSPARAWLEDLLG